jgi:hypothetical protein
MGGLKGVDWRQQLTLGGGKVKDVAIRLEHVDLLNALDGLDVHLLEGGLKLLVVTTTGSVDLLDLSSGRTLAAVNRIPSVSAHSLILVEHVAGAYPVEQVSRAQSLRVVKCSYQCARHFEDAGALLDPWLCLRRRETCSGRAERQDGR